MAKQNEHGIAWTDATWNPVTGCTKVSEGCRNCWAERMHGRFNKRPFSEVVCHPERLEQPLHWRRPRRIFVCSMGDLFHEQVPDEFIEDIFSVMALAAQHTFQILTKRPKRMLDWMNGKYRDAMIEGRAQKRYHDRTGEDPSVWLAVHLPLSNVTLGVSCENQATADERIPLLLQTPAILHFVSCEPLLGPVDLSKWL